MIAYKSSSLNIYVSYTVDCSTVMVISFVVCEDGRAISICNVNIAVGVYCSSPVICIIVFKVGVVNV
nr:hypothetical protein [uncultured Methanobrevibacter sp.]